MIYILEKMMMRQYMNKKISWCWSLLERDNNKTEYWDKWNQLAVQNEW